MAPLVEAFHPSRLEHRLKYEANGKLRKTPLDLKECTLKELLQYECDLNGPREDPRSTVVCFPLLRLFRQCANGMTVETTQWEGIHDNKVKSGDQE